ncbi:MarR family transcriptional regulator [Desulfolucanica intricata]|uniref:MarR family transcriptional regulator n=1 Tax=Desulfolucanica intricata TaxID=1285191 RepID=UPI0008302EDD|nr:MarR family transcriptional regulator [Desulfolucanica intricata]
MKTNELDDQINELNQVAKSMMRKFQDYMFRESDIDLTPVQQLLLKIIYYKGSSTPSEIAHEMGVTSGAVTSLTNRLFKQGYIVRERSEEDRRLVIIKLTTEGEKVAKLIVQEKMKKMRSIFCLLKSESIQSLCKIYREIDIALSSLLNS